MSGRLSRTQGAGVEVILDSLNQSDRPQCPHGPTILFERFCNGNVRRFYACSSSRDRKSCSFYQNEDDVVSKQTKRLQEEEARKYRSSLMNRNDFKRMQSALRHRVEERRFCRTCHLLLLPTELDAHRTHEVLTKVTDLQLNRPTSLLAPMENNKYNAQYLFSKKTTEFVLKTITELGFTHVLCVGAPCIHEAFTEQRSLLMDIDSRFFQFYKAQRYVQYNMFNHYFFNDPESETEYKKFLSEAKSGKLLIVTDPPFGGLVDLLFHTLQSISADFMQMHTEEVTEILPCLWFFPYFMENRIISKEFHFKMLDYKVDYSNHKSFQDGPKGRKHGSPVRIFTNISLSEISLPIGEGYRYCKKCEKFVSEGNKHCDICKDCTSKDGKTYVHCDVCERCVKPSRVHCFKCRMCLMPDHVCGKQRATGCHICGDFTHKRRDCPLKNSKMPSPQSKKRKLDDQANEATIYKPSSKRRKKGNHGKQRKKKQRNF